MTQIPTWSGGPVSPPDGRAAPGTTIGGRYALRAAVGHGGMGTVWRAADMLLRRDVAVKEVVLPPGLAPSDRDALYERTLREARAAAALQHPAVVQVYDVVTEGGRPWIVMELLDARSLADMVIEDGPVAPRAAAKIGIALLGALEVAHAVGVLHRDVKPANVLICTDGRCVLTDFGVARMPTDVQLTTPGMVLGSPHFISPERAMGQDFGPPSDLFSLGVTLYTAVEGRPPFDKGDPIETMHAVVEDPPAPPVRSGPLTPILLGLLEKDPARRFDVHTSRSMLRELLAGPLASNAQGHMTTDPYAVVPAPRAPWQAPVAPPEPTPTGQIGGRAMIIPGESLTDRLEQLRKAGGQSPQAQYAAGLDEPSPGTRGAATGPLDTPTGALDTPTGALSAPTGAMTPPRRPPAAPTSPRPPSAGPMPDTAADARTGTIHMPTGAMPIPHWDQPIGPPGAGSPAGGAHPGGNAANGQKLTGVRRSGAAVVSTVKGWPRKMQLAAAGGVAVVLVLAAVAVFGGSRSASPPPSAGPPATVPAGPGFETQPHAERGVSVNVPKGWKKSSAASYVDYVDPQDSGRRVRILVEQFGGESSHRWAEVAAGGLSKSAKSCARPYAQLSMTDVQLAAKPATQFEYNCGQGDGMRHGAWVGVLEGGKVYSFYLTTTEARFAESKKIFDEMVRSFQLTPAG